MRGLGRHENEIQEWNGMAWNGMEWDGMGWGGVGGGGHGVGGGWSGIGGIVGKMEIEALGPCQCSCHVHVLFTTAAAHDDTSDTTVSTGWYHALMEYNPTTPPGCGASTQRGPEHGHGLQ